MIGAGWFGSMLSEMFLQMKLVIFHGCPTIQAAFLHGHPTPHSPY